MAEAVGYAILGRIGENLVDPIGRQFGYLFCFNRNIQILQTQHDVLKATREGVQLGVNEARNNVRIVEPLAEAWLINANNKIAEAETTIESKAQVQKGCLKGWCWARYSLSRKAAKMTQDLVDLHTEGGKYTRLSHSPPPPSIQSLPSTGFKEFESRNLIVKQIIEALKDDEINLVGLCGMGGVGKTTMVKHVAKRVEEEKLFNEVAMAVVSQEPNLKQVQSCIAEMLGLKLDVESPIVRSSRLRERLLQKDKKILVILDDIWKEFDLEELGIPLGGGSNKSCKILFTSRNGNLWKGMQNKRYIELQVLVGEEPWHLFSENIGDCVDDLDLLPLAKDIVNECGGLPLALATIGRALTSEHSQHHWKNALQQLRNPCSESLSSEVPAEVYEALRFSYNFLKDDRAKKLFLLCCLFPEDHDISIEYLVRYGIGLRWFEGIDKVDEVRDRVNVLVDQLKSCYLLLDGSFEGWIKMHDVVHDVAISIAAKDKHCFMIIHGAKSREWPKKATYELNTSMSVISNEIVEFPEGLRCSKLEFLLIECPNSSLKIPSNFFKGMEALKVLDMTEMKNISKLPPSLQFLSNLLTLHLDQCEKFDDISVIGKLLNLEILTFHTSKIEELPEEIGRLFNLKLLDLTNCYKLKRVAPGVISALVQLQELYMGGCGIIWEREGKDGGENASLREFESLSNLNTIEIGIEDVLCLPRIPLFSKLTKYKILIGDVVYRFAKESTKRFRKLLRIQLDDTCTIPLECGAINSLLRSTALLHLQGKGLEDVVQELFREGVEGLQHLKELVIGGCATPKCLVNTTEWVPRTPNAILPIFPILEKLELSFLPNLRKICHCQLPTGSFRKLKHLTIFDCDGMEEVIWKEKREDDATNKMEFPALESLTLSRLPMLIGFCRGTDEIEFPQLKKLRLRRLPQLKWLFLNSSNPFSESMENHNATFLSLLPHKVVFPTLEVLELVHLDNLEGMGHCPPSSMSLSKLRYVHVRHCDKLIKVFQAQLLSRLQNLQELSIEDCSLLEKVVDCTEHNSKIFPLLKSLRLERLPQLNHISERDSIGFMYIPQSSILHIDGCDNLRFLFTQSMTQCILQLQKLEINRCKMMSAIVREEDSQGEILVDNIEFTQLKILQLYDLQNFVSIFPKVTSTVATSFEHIQNPGQSLFNEKVACPSLEELKLHGFQNMNEIWCNQLQTGSFDTLINLYVSDCGSLRNMFSPFMARHLVHLKSLVIIKCSMMEEVVAKEKDEEEEEKEGRINRTPFPKLEYLKLEDLPELKSFCHITHDWELPLVDDVSVLNCPKMKTFSHGVLCTPKLQRVFVKQGMYKWYPGKEGEDWLWISDLNQTILHLIEKVALPSLEELELKDLDNLEGLEHIPISVCSFSKLRKLHVERCGKWLCVFPSQVLTRLRNLEDLTVENFNSLEKVFELEMVDYKEQESEMLSLLKSLKLKHLPQLDYISKRDPIGFTYISQLSILHVRDCDNLIYLFPHSMTKCMLQLQELNITRCKMMSMIVADEKGQSKSSVDKIEFTQLKILKLYDLPNLVSFFPKVIATSATSTERLQNVMQTLFNEKVAFPSLEKLEICEFQNMNETWCNQFQTGSFNKLIELYVSNCGSLRNMFSPFMARHLVHLKRLVISKCSMMEEVVENEKDEEGGRINKTSLPKFEYLKLKDLPELKSFCHVTHVWELTLVEHITVLNCPKMKTFSPGVICTPKLQHVFVKEGNHMSSPGIEGEDWLWISNLNQTILHLIEKQQEEQLQKQQQEGKNEETCETTDDSDGDDF